MKPNQENKRLGFGLMRLPKKLMRTDVNQVSEMVDLFLDNGFNYFDTAYVYSGSEKAIKKALVDRYPREDYTIATKLNAFMAPTEKMAKNQFDTSLSRLGVDYFDFYLLHALMKNNVNRYDKFGIWEYLQDKREQGLIKHLGFSFHDQPELLEKLLREHPEIDFVQLQLNYADWENPNTAAHENYEVARTFNKPIVVMEPVKGGKLASPPAEVKELLKKYNPDASYASWALRYIASLDGIYTTLSGMSNVGQMKDNIDTLKNFKPLDEEEYKIIRKAQQLLGHSKAIECTACSYCTKNCPQTIPIPDIISALNKKVSDGQDQLAQEEYGQITQKFAKASDCIECKSCERSCPQHLPITNYLKQSVELFETE